MNNRSRLLLLCAVAMLAIAAGWFVGQHQREAAVPPELATGTILPTPLEIDAISLTDQDGAKLDLTRLKGQWTLVYLGYTFCPDVCPTTLAELSQMSQRLDDVNANEIQYLFVSVDPNRDTPMRLKEYIGYFGENFIAATGDSEELEQFANAIGQVFRVPENPSSDDYLVDHSSIVAVFDPTARLYAIFNAPHDADDMAEGLRQILNFRGS